ncbi:MAG: GNAT family N-acetyltransferase [Clostridiales bacterium]|nr:GNAT family N-acetyltransferase [Clostridiales bacterium]
MDKNQIAIQFLNRDYILNASIIEPIKMGYGEVLYADEGCVLFKSAGCNVYMLETDDMAKADKLLDTVPTDAAIVAHNDALADFVAKKMDFHCKTPCYQGVYLGQPLECNLGELTVRLMTLDEVGEACAMYHFKEDSAITHISRGLAYGAYVGDKTVGMVGMHIQGAMGLLSIKPEYRRNGYAEILERFLINKLLSEGKVPYCQIVEGNEPSLSLQRKLGLSLSKNKLYWMHKE